jgi:hypothetical protein
MNNGLKMTKKKTKKKTTKRKLMPKTAEDFVFDKNKKIYERQPSDTDKTWKSFVLYRDLGFARTLLKAAEAYKKETNSKTKVESIHSKIQQWSRLNHWSERAAAWDAELDRHKRNQQIYEIQDMKKRHIKLAKSLQGLGALGLQKWLNKIQGEKSSTKTDLTTGDVRALIELGAKMERLNREEPESIVKNEQEVKLELSVDEKRNRMRQFLENKEIEKEVRALAKKINFKDE